MALKTRKIFFHIDPSFKKCPSCGETNSLRRSRTKNLRENLMKYTQLIKIYRCRKCNWRGPLSTLVITKQSIKNLLIYIVVLLFTLAVVYKLIQEVG